MAYLVEEPRVNRFNNGTLGTGPTGAENLLRRKWRWTADNYNAAVLHLNYEPMPNDRTHNLRASGVATLPLGKNKTLITATSAGSRGTDERLVRKVCF